MSTVSANAQRHVAARSGDTTQYWPVTARLRVNQGIRSALETPPMACAFAHHKIQLLNHGAAAHRDAAPRKETLA
jgi:hypothetical protein